MARLSAADWLGRLRAKGWTRDQIQQATGASPSTQYRLQSGKQKSSRYDEAIREAGGKYSRRKAPPAEYPHRGPLKSIVDKLNAANLRPDVDYLVSTFGKTGARAILKGQLWAYNRYLDDGVDNRQEGDPDSWFWTKGPDMMRRYGHEGLWDPSQFINSLFYTGRR